MYKILGADQKEYGPVSLEQLRQWVAEGRANTQTLVQGPNSTEWKPLGAMPELSGLVPASPPATSMPPTQRGAVPGSVPNYLWQSIVVTLCCCLPLGVVAIVFSAQVNSKLAAGDLAGAADASSKARLFCWLALGLGLLVNLGFGIMGLLGELGKM